ncbi:MAG: carboxypeptidase regulatory-like domain-containing protein [Planctomycetota bacterium]|nr:carboxypeptidase regulatory-like domain-containing protein [Planctomycetota bacterium]MDA1113247.1 carboxypeptidase regulatory-like domain-containing protein [Planctomycetota bacterium]
MKRLLPLVALVAIALLIFWIFQDGSPNKEALDDPTVAESEEVVAAATLDRGPERLVEAEAEPFNPRVEKVGDGNFGLVGTVVDEKGVPMADMWVAAYGGPYPFFDFEVDVAELIENPLELSLEPIASTRSDADGKFQLEGLYGRGQYLVARGNHHLTRGRQEIRPSDLDSEEGLLVHTIPGAHLEGSVMDEFGAPVANAEVFVGPSLLYIPQAIRNRDIYLDRVFTDGAGRYSIDVVPANMKLSVVALDGATHPGMRDFGPLNPGTDADIKVQLAPTGGLSGTIENSDGESISGAKVLAIPIDMRMLVGVVRAFPDYIVESKADGSFEFPRLPKRNVVLFAQGRDGRAIPVASAVTSQDSVVGKPLVLQTMHDLTGRVISMDGKGIAGAKVLLNSIPMPESNDRGRGMPSADNMLMEMAKEILPELIPAETWAITDSSGRFNIAAWEGAKLRIEAPEYSKAVYSIPREMGDKKLALIMMEPGGITGTVSNQDDGTPLTFYAVNGTQDSSYFTPAEEPVALELAGFGDGDWREKLKEQEAQRLKEKQEMAADIIRDDETAVLPEKSAMDNLRNIQMKEDGNPTFLFEGLMPGNWTIEGRADGYVVEKYKNIRVEPGAITEGIELKMSRGATLSGRVVAFGSREPVAGAVVTIGRSKESGFSAYFRMGVETTAMARSKADGSFTLQGIEAGMEWVHVIAEGFSPTSIRGNPLEKGEVRNEVVIQVRQGSNIHGHVVDRHGVPIPARLVGGFSMDTQDFWQTSTDEEGYYHVEHVKPGSYFIITASLDDEALFTGNLLAVLNGSRLVQCFAREGETHEVDIEDLSAGGCNMKGRILNQGAPLKNATIFAMGSGGSMFDMRMATAQADEEGEFEFKSLAPGDYTLRVDAEEWEGGIELIVPDADEDYQVLETPQGVVRGRVLTETNGTPVDNATVKLIRDDSTGGMFAMFTGGKETDYSDTDENGNFEFESKAAGRYHVEVEINSWGNRDASDGSAPLGNERSKSFTLYENDTKVVDDIKLPASSAIRVLLKNVKGEAPDQGYTLTAIREGQGDGEETFSNWGFGEEGLISGVSPGTYTVRVEGRGFAKAQMEGVLVGEAETVEVELLIQEGVQLNARILGPNSQPLPEAAIKVFDTEGKRVDGLDGPTAAFSRMFGSEGGTVSLGTYVPGSYVVEVEYDGQVQTKNAMLNADGSTIVEFQFR